MKTANRYGSRNFDEDRDAVPSDIDKDNRVALAEIEKLWGTSRCDGLFSRCTH
jgi:hypothetical protein